MLKSSRVALIGAASLVLLAAGEAPRFEPHAGSDTSSAPRLELATFTAPAPNVLFGSSDMADDDAPVAADEAAKPPVANLAALIDAITDLPEVRLDRDARCLAIAVYHEAKSEPLEGQLAVAQVILNRVESGKYAATVCGVVHQPRQFSFTRDRRSDTPTNGAQWRTAQAIAVVAVTRNWRNVAPDALSFHATRVAPSWRNMQRVSTIGNHVFYRQR